MPLETQRCWGWAAPCSPSSGHTEWELVSPVAADTGVWRFLWSHRLSRCHLRTHADSGDAPGVPWAGLWRFPVVRHWDVDAARTHLRPRDKEENVLALECRHSLAHIVGGVDTPGILQTGVWLPLGSHGLGNGPSHGHSGNRVNKCVATETEVWKLPESCRPGSDSPVVRAQGMETSLLIQPRV